MSFGSNFFVKMEVGEVLQTQRYIFEPCGRLAFRAADIELDPTVLKTRLAIEAAIRSLKSGTAPGLDAIPLDFLLAAIKQFADKLWPLAMKATTGGKGPLDTPENYRSFFISFVPGKVNIKL